MSRGLDNYSTAELLAEIERRKIKPARKERAGRCENCGEVWYFQGVFTPHFFEVQKTVFQEKHKDCLPIFNGGCI